MPDYQGIGIGMAVAEAVAELHCAEGHRLNVTASHPALLAHCRRSPLWRAVQVRKTGSRNAAKFIKGYRGSAGRAVVSFQYLGRPASGAIERGEMWNTAGPGRGEEAAILAIVAVGCSRSMAATYVGCAIRTIQNTAERDPTFAEKLRQAVYSTELGLLKNIRNAAKKEQYWRAAAWRWNGGSPNAMPAAVPTFITIEQVMVLLGQFSDIVAEEVPGRCRKRVLKRLEKLAESLSESARDSAREVADDPQ